MMDYLEGERSVEEHLKAAIRQATLDIALTPVLCGSPSRTRACRCCSTPWSTTCRRPRTSPPSTGIDPRTGDGGHPGRRRRGAVQRAGLQDHGRPVRGQAHVLPGLLRECSRRGRTSSTPPRSSKERVGRILQMHANHREDRTEIFAGDIGAAVGLKFTTTGDTLTRSGPPDRPRVHGVPRAGHLGGHRAEDQGRPGPAGREPGEAWPRKTRRSGCGPTRRPARPSSPAWASCTWRSSSTACCGSSRSTPTWAVRRWPTARPIRRTVREGRGPLRPPDRRPGSVRPRGPAAWSPPSPARGSSSRTRSWAVSSPGVHPGGRRRAWSKPWRPASRPASRWWTSRSS